MTDSERVTWTAAFAILAIFISIYDSLAFFSSRKLVNALTFCSVSVYFFCCCFFVLVVSCFLSVLMNFEDRNTIHFLQMKEALSSNPLRNIVKISKTVFLQSGLSVRKLDFQLQGVHLDYHYYLIILILSKY